MTVEAKIDAVQANALKALENAAEAQRLVREEERARAKAFASLESRMEGTEQSLTSFARRLVVDGIPLTVTGLVFAALGLLLQAVAGIATFNGMS